MAAKKLSDRNAEADIRHPAEAPLIKYNPIPQRHPLKPRAARQPMPLGTHVHYDQLTFTAKVNHKILHAALAAAFGPGKPIHRHVDGRKQVGMAYSGTSIWASYTNAYKHCWLFPLPRGLL